MHPTLKKWLIVIFITAISVSLKTVHAQTIRTIVGGVGDTYGAATAGRVLGPQSLALDAAGNLYIAENSGTGGKCRFRKVSTSGIITTVAGNGMINGYTGFSKPAIDAQTSRPEGITVDASGNILLAYSQFISKVDAFGNLFRVAGTGVNSFSGDGSLSSTATLNTPYGIATDVIGNIYIADRGNNRIRKINTAGIILTVAGGGVAIGDGGAAIAANLNHPTGVAVDAAGNIYIADGNKRIRKVNTAGIITTIAGNGITSMFSGLGGAATAASIGTPHDVKVDVAGNVYFSTDADRVCKISTSGILSNIAGTGTSGFSGDGGAANSATLNNPLGIVLDPAGNIFIADSDNDRVRKVNTSGIINTVAGNGLPLIGFFGDGGPAILAGVGRVTGGGSFSALGLAGWLPGVAIDRKGNLFITDVNNQRIRKIDTAGIITTIAGNGIMGYAGDGGPATAAQLYQPIGVSLDWVGNVYFAEYGSHHIRKIDTAGIITTIAGGGSSGLGDGGPATAAIISAGGLCVDSIGNVFIVDVDSQRIRKVAFSTGIITTIAGNGIAGFGGDGGPAVAAKLHYPIGVAIDSGGNIYISDYFNSRIRKVDNSGIITTLAGNGNYTGTSEIALGDNGPATAASIASPTGITADKYGNIYFADWGNGPSNVYDSFSSSYSRIRQIDKYGYIRTVAGNGIEGYSGDGGNPTSAELLNAWGIAIDSTDHLYIADNGNFAIRKACCIVNPTNRPPTFTGGIVQTLNVCISSGTTSINSIMAISDADIGNTESWIVTQSPTHGTLGGFTYSAISTGGIIIPTGLTYMPTIGFSGLDTFIIKIDDGDVYSSTMVIVTISPLPGTGVISGPSTVCINNIINLSDNISGGAWSSSNSAVATIGTSTGIVTGVSIGNSIINYTRTSTCGSASATYTITVNPLPFAGTISGPSTMCVGALVTLSDNIPGGTWMSADPYVFIGSGGIIAGLAGGTATISYLVSNICGTTAATYSVTVYGNPNPGIITGNTSICTGGTTALSNAAVGGTWSSANPFVATISSTGVVTGIATGFAIISYTVSNLCNSASTISIINVMAATPIAPITGPSSVCTGLTISLVDASPGGTWTSSNTAVAVVNSTGVVTGITSGITTISYIAGLGCGISVAATNITVNSSVSAGAISGGSILCTGASALLTNYIPGGAWSSTNSYATISGTGVVTGVNPGTETITYTVTNGCGTTATTFNINIFPAPSAGSIVGASSVCAGASIALTDVTPGGVWSSNNTSVAIVNSTGIVNGITGGTAIISYAVTTGCGTIAAIRNVTVDVPFAGFITGVTTLCVGGTSLLNNTIAGGTWSSSNSTVATISTAGFVTSSAAGTSIISYTVNGACGTAVATAILTVGTLPVVAPITGATTVCAGTTATLADVTLGGVWSSNNSAVATINSLGVVTGVSAGTATISYLVTAGCGTTGVISTITVNAAPSAGTISGSPSLCVGASTTLGESVTGGLWSTVNTSIAFIGSSTGTVTGLTSGSATITYTVANICGTVTTTKPITISPLPSAGSISGTTGICIGSTGILSDNIASGIWTSSNTTIALIGPTSGVITSVSTGGAIISYSFTNSCGTDITTQAISINPLPNAGTISGLSSVCAGSTIGLTDNVTGGVWSSSAPAILVVNSSGIVTGVSTGTATVLYSFTNSCGTAIASRNVTVNVPSAGSITGVTTLCPGGVSVLNNAVTGGIWNSSAPGVAAINASGVVTAIAAGSSIISYTVTNICGTATTTTIFTVSSLPVVSPITGTTNICTGTTTPLADATVGGVWSSSSPTIASVNSTGNVTGLSGGTATISYMVTAGCGTAGVIAIITVSAPPSAGSIFGSSAVCVGAATTLSENVTGGVWSSNNTTIAIVGASTGIVNGIATGSAIITYAVTNICGAITTTAAITVNPLPGAGVISGTTGVCIGSTGTVSDVVPGGVWSSSNTVAATINGFGTITSVSVGSTVISYAVTNSCGTAVATHPVPVNPLPDAGIISGPSSVCAGATIALTDALVGGSWNSTVPSVAGVSGSGVVSGISGGTTIILFSVTNSCGTAVATKSITVDVPTAGTITGVTSICAGDTTTLHNVISGGAWSSSNTSVATISGSGLMSAIAPGTTIISYIATDACGTATATTTFTVGSLPAVSAITGNTGVCSGSTTALANGTAGGAWSSSDPAKATVSTSGVVTGISAGTVTISYMVTAGCGTGGSTLVMHVDVTPVAGIITGSGAICKGTTATLIASVTGGVWSGSNDAIALINQAGVVAGITTGNVTISYSVTNSCGTVAATAIESIISLPDPGNIINARNICVGAANTLSNAVSGGIWSSSSPTIAIINNNAVVTGIATGSTVISYTISNSCGANSALTTVNIDPLPFILPITGPAIVPIGGTITLGDPVAGGAWSSSTTAVAAIDAGGIVTGIAEGATTISYTIINSFGCTAYDTIIISASGNPFTPEIKIYPSPATSYLTIDAPVKVNVIVFGVDGKLLLTKDDATSIDIRGFANGLYIIWIYDQKNNHLKTVKFVKRS